MLIKNYLNSSVHLGHSTKELNPKIVPYLLKKKKNFNIINLSKTCKFFQLVGNILEKKATKGGKFLFVGTTNVSSPFVLEEALRTNNYYIISRWLGGTLSNWPTLQKRVGRFLFLEKQELSGNFNFLSKKYLSGVKKEIKKLRFLFKGIKNMKTFPNAVIFIDHIKECAAIQECINLGIPTITLVDTNCEPDSIIFPIYSNNDSSYSISTVLKYLGDRIISGNII